MKTIITAGPPPGQLRLLDRNLSQSLPSRHYWPLRLAARTFTLLTAALLLSAGAIRADLVLSMNPSDYNTETKQWPIADGSMTGDYFAAADWGPLNDLSKTLMPPAATGYSAIAFPVNGNMLGGPLAPSSITGSSARTIEAWVYTPTPAKGGCIFDISRQYGADNSNFGLCNFEWNAIQCNPDGNQDWGGTQDDRFGKWVFLAASYDGTTLRLYVNGAETSTKAFTYATEAGGSMTIGMMRYAFVGTAHSTDAADGWPAYHGCLGSIRVYDEARSASDIATAYGLGVNYGETASPEYKIVASAGSGGTISPSGDMWVGPGANQTFLIEPWSGYTIASVVTGSGGDVTGSLVDISYGGAKTYTFTGVAGDDTITATFTPGAHPATRYEAENPANTFDNCVTPVEFHPNCSGGACAGKGWDGAYGGFTVNVTAPEAGLYNMTVADGGYADRPTWVKVNGTDLPGNPFTPATRNGDNQGTFTCTVTLLAGDNTVTIFAPTWEWGPHWDYIDVENTPFEVIVPTPVSGNVSDAGGGIAGATVYFSTTPGAIGSSITATTVASPAGDYSKDLLPGTYYIAASAVGYLNSTDLGPITVAAEPVTGQNFMLATDPAYDPDLLFSVLSSAYSGGATWPTACPAGKQLNRIGGSPGTTVINGQNWEMNHYATADAFQFPGPNSDNSWGAIPVSGATIVAAVRPIYTTADTRGEVVDIMYDRLVLAVNPANGRIITARQANWYDSGGYTIPNGQITILSMVVQSDGTFKVYANGTQVMNVTDTASMAALDPTVPWGADYTRFINVGRNQPDGWPTFSGNIGDVYVYKVALDDTKRTTLESSLTDKYGTSPTYTINASAGSNGTINPSGAVSVPEGTDQTFRFVGDPGYVPDEVTIDSDPPVPVTSWSYTFTDVTAERSISVTFKPRPPVQKLIDLTVGSLSGSVTSWPNAGTLGGQFVSDGDKDTAAATVDADYGSLGKKAVVFNNSKLMLSTDASTADGSLIRAPSLITGNGTYTVFAEICSTSDLAFEQYYFAFAHNGDLGNCAAFGYGTAPAWGAVAHWDWPDMGWFNPEHDGGPSINAWHYVAITFNGTTEKVYLDGVEVNSENKTLDLWLNNPFTIGCRFYDNNGWGRDWPFNGALAALQVYDDALSAAQIAALSIGAAAPVASFDGGPTSGTVPPGLTVFFTNTSHKVASSDGNITNCLWNFGDSVITNSAPTDIVSHQYTGVTNYTVTLTVQDDNGLSSSVTNENMISVTARPPVAPPEMLSGKNGFYIDPATGHATVKFTAQDGVQYTLEYKDDLLATDPGWQPCCEPITTNGTPQIMLQDTNDTHNVTQRYYRIEANYP